MTELKPCIHCKNYPTIDVKSASDYKGVRVHREDLYSIHCCRIMISYRLKSMAINEWNEIND